MLPALPNSPPFISFLYPQQLLSFLLLAHWGSREQERKQARKGTSCFSVPLRGAGGQGKERRRVLGALSASEGSSLGQKGQGEGGRGGKERRRCRKGGELVGSMLFPASHPPTSLRLPSRGSFQTQHTFSRKSKRETDREGKRVEKV